MSRGRSGTWNADPPAPESSKRGRLHDWIERRVRPGRPGPSPPLMPHRSGTVRCRSITVPGPRPAVARCLPGAGPRGGGPGLSPERPDRGDALAAAFPGGGDVAVSQAADREHRHPRAARQSPESVPSKHRGAWMGRSRPYRSQHREVAACRPRPFEITCVVTRGGGQKAPSSRRVEEAAAGSGSPVRPIMRTGWRRAEGEVLIRGRRRIVPADGRAGEGVRRIDLARRIDLECFPENATGSRE